MEARLDGALLVGSELNGFLLSQPKSCFLHGDLVVLESGRLDPSPSLQSAEHASHASSDPAEVDHPSENAPSSPSSSPNTSPLHSASSPPQHPNVDQTTASEETQASLVESHTDRDAVVERKDSEEDELSIRKACYKLLASENTDRSIESIVTSLSGCMIVSSVMERISAAFMSGKYWKNSVAIVRKLKEDRETEWMEWLVTGFAVGTDAEGKRCTLWRGKQIFPQCDVSSGIGWLPLGSVEESISVCLKIPNEWNYKVFYGQFPESIAEREARGDMALMEDEDEEEYDNSPQYVLSVPGSGKTKTVISFELLNDINFIEGTALEVYGVDGEEYEAVDDPRVFWTPDCLVAKSSPACQKSSLTGLELDLDADMVYMLVPVCTQPLQYCIRIASEYPVEITAFTEDSDESDDSDVGSLY